jgi:uncharacterized protein (DUF608 family)
LDRTALPLGGIGAGTVSLGGRGDLRDWEVMNRPAKGYVPRRALFALYCRPLGGEAVTRLLEGPLPDRLVEGPSGSPAANAGLPRFATCTYEAAYPLAQVLLEDPNVPLQVRLEAFNPLIPADADASGLPVAVLRYVLHNPTDQAITAAVCGSVENFIGNDGVSKASRGNVNEWHAGGDAEGVCGIIMRSNGVDPGAGTWGTLALATTAPAEAVTHRLAWTEPGFFSTDLLDFWDDFSTDGRLDPRPHRPEGEPPVGSLCVNVEVPPGDRVSITFLLAWHFPNRWSWTNAPADPPANARLQILPSGERRETIVNHYATRFADAWAVAGRTAASLPHLECRTLAFVRAVCATAVPAVVKEAALNNLTALRSQTSFRLATGELMGWEGCGDDAGCCPGSCTHVWNYDLATPHLFGELARSMRRIEFLHGTDERGKMSFRVELPLNRGREYVMAAADGQLGCIVKLYREWRLSGDDAFLRELWPAARRTMEFCWLPGGWDADRDGVMEGCQHNTMDVDYYGPNPQMQGWYLAALLAAARMARHVDEPELADECRRMFDGGRAHMGRELFNGEYFEHHVQKPADPAALLAGTQLRKLRPDELADGGQIDSQLASGCLVDQLVGPLLARTGGLGDDWLDPSHVRTTLESILRYNFRQRLGDHVNVMRTYALADEPGLLMGSYPRGNRPIKPFPYYPEVMTGFEYTAAVHMLFHGMRDEGLKVIAAVRSRYDGTRRNPFNEAECGHHYARAMVAWGAMLALSGFDYDAHLAQMSFAELPAGDAHWFWSTGDAWGTYGRSDAGAPTTLKVLGGRVRLQRVMVGGKARLKLDQPTTFDASADVLAETEIAMS